MRLAPSQFFPVHYLCRPRCRHLRSKRSGLANSTAMRNIQPFSSPTRKAGRWRSMRSTAPAAFWEKTRSRFARRWWRSGGRSSRRRRAGDRTRLEHPLSHVPVECRPRHHRIRGQEESLFSCRRTADRQDHLAGRQPLYLPSATFDLQQVAMQLPEALAAKKTRWALVYPNYEYGQSAAAAFKALMKARQRDVEFVIDQASPLGKIDAGAVRRQSTMPSPMPSSAPCSAAT